jgi:predicted nucleic acid-binding protein
MTIKRLFVDTAGWVMMADGSDRKHAAAIAARDKWLKLGGVLLTTDFVLDETLTLLRVRLSLDAAEAWWEQIDASPRVLWEWIDPERAEKARRWFFRFRDKSFSFTDCTSFVVMKDLRIRHALTSDHHFVQAGFELLP